jgi:hypothetical protein
LPGKPWQNGGGEGFKDIWGNEVEERVGLQSCENLRFGKLRGRSMSSQSGENVLRRILGVSAYYHDSAAALLCDGVIVAAAQEERFSRKKHDSSFPARSIRYCLQAGNISVADLDGIVFYDKPLLKFERLLETYLSYAPAGFRSFVKAMPIWLKEKLFLTRDSIFPATITHTQRPRSIQALSRTRQCCAWTVSASGRRPRPGWAPETNSSRYGNCSFRIRWDCSTPRLHISQASGSTRESTN